MKKALSVWGVLTVLGLCTIANIPIYEPEVIEPPKWEKIPEAVEVKEISVEQHDLILHYDPIEPMYQPREYSCKEAQMLMRIAQAEAGNQGIFGMELVMMVVLNRVADEAFPNTIEGVIFQPHQFQPVEDGRYWEVEISPEAHLALADIEKGIPIDEEVVAFEITSNSKTLERYFTYCYTEGDHDFYIAKGGR